MDLIKIELLPHSFHSYRRLSDIRVYYDCVAGENQLCDATGHVQNKTCAPGYYGDKCRLYCNATMFDNCNCTEDGNLQCTEKPVGVYFDVQLISAHIPPSMHNTSYTLSLDQRYSHTNPFCIIDTLNYSFRETFIV